MAASPYPLSEQEIGTINLRKLFEHNGGDFSITLTDSARDRTFNTEIDFEINIDTIRCWKRSAKPENRIYVSFPCEVKITPEMIPFLGLYEGDGNKGSFKGKASNIGFGGAHYSLQKLAKQHFSNWFGSSFSTNWHILTDSKQFFFGNEVRSDLTELFEEIEQELIDNGAELSNEIEVVTQRLSYNLDFIR